MTASAPHDRAFWRHALGRRRPDGSLAEGPMTFANGFWAWLGAPSAETAATLAREAVRADARQAEAARRTRRRQAIPAPALAVPHPRTCKKVVRALGRAA